MLPPFTRPGLRALAGLSIVRIRCIEVGRQQHLLVRAHAIGPPDLLARVDVIGCDVAAHPELTTGDAGDILVFDHQASPRHGLALRRVGVFRLPELLPRIGVERNDLSIQRVHDDLALDVIQTAMDHVAAGHGHCLGILLRRIVPLDGIGLLRKVQGIDVVREGRVDIHRGADDQRCPFMAPQGSRRERPGNF